MKNGNGNSNNGLVENNPKYKFLFVSWEGFSGDLAWYLVKEGHEVKFYLKDQDDPDIYDGVFTKVDKWEKHVDWADVVIFDDTGFGKAADNLRKKGKLVIGGSEYTDRLEEDREFGQSEMKTVGMLTLPHWSFSEFDAAINFIKQNPGRYVFKPSGSITAEQKGVLFIGQEDTGSDLIEILEHNKGTWAKKFKKFQLQRYAHGIEVAVGAFFNGRDFIYPLNINFEHKKLFPGEIGLSTFEMGTLMYWTSNSTFFTSTLQKLKDKLMVSGYIGYVDINCIANNYAIYPLEVTTRFGYPTISIQLEGLLTPTGEWLMKLARGETFEIKTKRGFQVGVVVAVPPFPFFDTKEANIYKDMSIIFKRQNMDGVHLGFLKYSEGDWRLASSWGFALIVTGSGTTVAEARKMAYNRIDDIVLQNKFYRTDIGQRWNTDSDKLQTWGYLY